MSSKKKKAAPPEVSVELNVMPFIDIFSLLCTFLLFSAVFVSIGIHEVQVPFLSNATPPPAPKETSKKKNIEFKVELTEKFITLTVKDLDQSNILYKKDFSFSDEDLKKFNIDLLDKKQKFSGDTLTFFSEDTVIYDKVAKTLDAIKLPPIQESNSSTIQPFLFSKVIIGSISL